MYIAAVVWNDPPVLPEVPDTIVEVAIGSGSGGYHETVVPPPTPPAAADTTMVLELPDNVMFGPPEKYSELAERLLELVPAVLPTSDHLTSAPDMMMLLLVWLSVILLPACR